MHNLNPETVEFCMRMSYKFADINFQTNKALTELQKVKAELKQLALEEDKCKMAIMSYMKDAEYMLNLEGDVLVTWKSTKKGNRVLKIK